MLPQMSCCYRGFYETWCMLDIKIDLSTVNNYTIPWIVNGSFACEVGMKYILQQNNIEFDKVHLLHELYNLLPDSHKMAITKELFEKFPSYTLEQLNQEILLLSDAFCNFRYFYENSLTVNMHFFKVWCLAIYKQVDKYRSYTIVERTASDSITIEEFDEKMLKVNNEMLSNLKKRNRQKVHSK